MIHLIKQTGKKSLGRLGVILLGALYIGYNALFVRPDAGASIVNLINPVPYATHFVTEQNQPQSFFTLPAFPSYAQWCHEHKKFCSIVPLQKVYADMQWIGSIQFVGSTTSRETLQGLYSLLDNVTNLDPYRYGPYEFGTIMIPMPKTLQGSGIDVQQQTSYRNAEFLALKGENYICDPQKILAIDSIPDESFMQQVYASGNSAIRNACPSYELPYFAGFNAFNYTKNIEDAKRWYKIAGFQDDAPTMAPLMSALVLGRGGQHIKSAALWYERYQQLVEGDLSTMALSGDIDKAIRKAVTELQYQYLDEAQELAGSACQKSYTCLVTGGYVRKALQQSQINNCATQENRTYNLRCVLTQEAKKRGWISADGTTMTYPDSAFSFGRSDEYNSWWIDVE